VEERIARIALARGIFQAGVVAEAVFRPRGVVEGQRDAGLSADAVERTNRRDPSGRRLVCLLIRIQVVQDVQQRDARSMLGGIEEAAIRALHFSEPAVRPTLLRGCLAGRADGETGGCRRAEDPTQKATPMRRL